MVIGVFAVFTVIIALQAPGLWKKKMWKELVVFFVIISLGLIYTIGQIYHWPLPNPEKRMEYLFVTISKKLGLAFTAK